MTDTAIRAEQTQKETIIFSSEAHGKFYYEKLKEVWYQDAYHKALGVSIKKTKKWCMVGSSSMKKVIRKAESKKTCGN